MKNNIFYIIFFLFFHYGFTQELLIVDDFDTALSKNKFGKDTVIWTNDPSDKSVWLETSFDGKVKCGNSGYSLKIDYNIQSAKSFVNPQGYSVTRPEVINRTIFAYCTRVETDVSRYKYLTFYIKGDDVEGYPRILPIEVKDNTFKPLRYTVEGITSEWQRVVIPLNVFKNLDLKNFVEIVFIFDNTLDRKKGRIYIDNINFAEKIPKEIEFIKESFYSIYTSEILIDAEFNEDEYDSKEVLSLDTKQDLEFGVEKNKKDLFVSLYSCYNEEKICFFVDVKDDNLTEKDRVELYFDINYDGFVYNGEDDYDFVFYPYKGGDSSKIEKNVSYAVKKTKDRYQIEIGISWNIFKIHPEKGKSLSFAVAVEDRDDYKYSSRINWMYTVSEDRIKLGRLILR